MGLDMYLYGVKYYSKYERDEQGNYIRDKTQIIKTEEIYWRKANEIHNWFVEYVQDGEDDCKSYCVSIGQLEDLLEKCNKVKRNKDKAHEILPTTEGFFFGSTEYDEYYFESIKYTITELRRLLENKEDYDWFEYRSSW